MQLEWHQLGMKYEALRIEDAGRQARLITSITQLGQQSAVLVVKDTQQWVLIDGYARVSALRKMGRDTVWAVEMPMGETEALVLCHRLVNARRRTAMEDGWLVRELIQVHGLSQRQVATKLYRSKSWVSRRLALVHQLPIDVERQVRCGKLCAYAAERYLVPLARANSEQCEKIARGICGEGLSTRQVGEIYHAWRRADKQVRERIAQNPMLCLRSSHEAIRPLPPHPADELLSDIEAVGGLSRRASKRLRKVGRQLDDPVKAAWHDTRYAFEALSNEIMERIGA